MIDHGFLKGFSDFIEVMFINNVLNGMLCFLDFESKTCVLTLGRLFSFFTGYFES